LRKDGKRGSKNMGCSLYLELQASKENTTNKINTTNQDIDYLFFLLQQLISFNFTSMLKIPAAYVLCNQITVKFLKIKSRGGFYE